MATLDDLKKAVIDGEDVLVEELTQKAIDEGVSPEVILNDGLIGGMDVVGQAFKDGTMFVPEVMMTAAAMAARSRRGRRGRSFWARWKATCTISARNSSPSCSTARATT